jgi:predicted nucleic acid-binding protein
LSYLLDTCILLDHLNGCVEATAFLRDVEDPAISQVTWIEVLVGARNEVEELALKGLLSTFEVLPVDDEVAEAAVRLRRVRRLKIPDAIILATARVHGRTLATRNTKDFPERDPDVAVPYRLPESPR